jgi:uncharacterized membrane protein
MGAIQSLLGVMFVLIGCVHFGLRDREPQTRSIYFGGLRLGVGTRTVLALCEVLIGAGLVLTAT